MKNKISVLVLSLCMLAASMTVITDNAFAGTVGINTSAKGALLEEINTVDNSDKCGYEPAVGTPLGHVERSSQSSNKKYSQGRELYSSPISGASEESTARLGKQYLTEKEYANCLTAYERIVAGIDARSDEIVISYENEDYDITVDEVNKVFNIVKEDYPEFFWLGNGFGYYYYTYDNDYSKTKYISQISPDYLFGTEEEVESANAEFTAEVDSILENVQGSTLYEKELWLHDYLVKHNEYILDAPYAHTAYGAIVEGEVVCEGYTRAFQLLLNKLGIENYTVTGSDQTGDNPQINHIWNMVCLDDEWYQVDVTWDDRGEYDDEISYAYFNITTEMIGQDHSFVGNYIDIPLCNSYDYWYYNINSRHQVSVTEYRDADDLYTLAGLIAEFINDYGYARIYVTDEFANEEDGQLLGNLYASEAEGGLRDMVSSRMYIDGGYSYGYLPISEREWNLYMSVDEDDPEYPGRIVAADVWDWFYQNNDIEDVVIRAYNMDTPDEDIMNLIRMDAGVPGCIESSKDNEYVCEAQICELAQDEEDAVKGLYYAPFILEGIPLGDYKIALYKPGCPVRIYDNMLSVKVGGVSIVRAFNDYAWWLNRLGDVDDNWYVDASDAIFMQRYIAGWEAYQEAIDWYSTNLNNDETIDIRDLIILQRHLAGWKKYENLENIYYNGITIDVA